MRNGSKGPNKAGISNKIPMNPFDGKNHLLTYDLNYGSSIKIWDPIFADKNSTYLVNRLRFLRFCLVQAE